MTMESILVGGTRTEPKENQGSLIDSDYRPLWTGDGIRMSDDAYPT